MKNMPAGQYAFGESVIHRLDARAKIIGLFLLLFSIVATSTLWGYLLALSATAGIVFLARQPIQTVLDSIKRLWLFCLIIILMNALFWDGGTTLWSFGFIRVSAEGIRQGVQVVLNVLLIVVLSNVLTRTTAPMKATSALASLLTPLKWIRVPVEEVAMILSVAMQFIPTLLEEAEMIKKAQTARGARFESKKLTERALSFLPLIVPIFLSAFRRADELSIAMEARGYRNAQSRTKRPPERLQRKDFAALICCAAVCFAQIFIIG